MLSCMAIFSAGRQTRRFGNFTVTSQLATEHLTVTGRKQVLIEAVSRGTSLAGGYRDSSLIQEEHRASAACYTEPAAAPGIGWQACKRGRDRRPILSR